MVALMVLSACPALPLPPKRPPTNMVVVQDVPGVSVKLDPNGYSGWTFRIANNRDEQLALVWDASSFIGSDGGSRGRLVHGTTLVIDRSRVQLSLIHI